MDRAVSLAGQKQCHHGSPWEKPRIAGNSWSTALPSSRCPKQGLLLWEAHGLRRLGAHTAWCVVGDPKEIRV